MLLFTVVLAVFSVTTAENCEPHDGLRQSPIDFDLANTSPTLGRRFKWSKGYSQAPAEMSLVDDGYSLRLTVKSDEVVELSGGPLEVPHQFRQLHFHWGPTNDLGSEHTMNGRSYPMEMHALHSQSVSNWTDENAVLGFFFQLSPFDNNGLKNILEAAVAAAENRSTPVPVKPFQLRELIPQITFFYYSYKGSLTTPPYSENVNWMVSSFYLPISQRQLDVFRKAAQVDNGMLNNYRCVQNLNARTVRLVVPY